MKKTGKILKKALGLLTVLTMILSCLAVISVSAEVGEGNKIVSIDSLWTMVGETETKLASTHAGYAPSYHPAIGDRIGSGIYVGYETGNSGNVVLKNGSNASGVWNYKNNGIPSTNIQKWEVKVKFETTSDDVFLFGFANNGYLYPQAHSSATRTDAKYGSWVKITDGYVQVVKNGNWTSLNSATLLADTWYTVVRYVDFSTSGNILNRVLVFDNAGELVVDSGTSWLVCSDMTGKANLVGFEVSSGNVMFDDFAIYEVLDSNMSQAMHYPVAGESTAKDYTIDSYLWNAVGQVRTKVSNTIKPYDLSISNSGTDVTRNAWIMIDKESEDSTNIVLENSEGETGVWMYRSVGYSSIPTAKKQKWEVKVKLSSNTDSVKLFGYSGGSYYDYKNERCVSNSAYSDYGTFVKINGGDVKIGNTGSTTIGTDCIVANKWYTVVRYMDFTTTGTTYDRVLVYDDAGKVVADSGEWKMSGRMTAVPKALIFTVDSASTCVQFDDLALYEVSSFDALSAEDASITPGEIKIAFSKPMDAETFDADAVTLTSAGRNIELKSVSYNEADNTILIGFNQLLYNTAYTLRIDNEVMKIDVQDYIDWYPTSPFVFDFTTEADPLTVAAVAFKDDNGDAITTNTLNANDKVKGSATLINTSATPRPYVIIIAIYEGDKMVDVKALSGTIANTAAAGQEIMTEALTVKNAGSRAEVFVWDSWATIRPLIEKGILPTPAL